MFMQVTADPVSITQEKFLFPVCPDILYFPFSVMFLKSLLQLAINTNLKLIVE